LISSARAAEKYISLETFVPDVAEKWLKPAIAGLKRNNLIAIISSARVMV
jgi:hypothetical protein